LQNENGSALDNKGGLNTLHTCSKNGNKIAPQSPTTLTSNQN